MSSHHYNGETTINEDKTIRQRRHSRNHSPFNGKAASVIDHLKLKVKRKRSSKEDLEVLPNNSISNQNLNNNNNKPLYLEQTEISPRSSTKLSFIEDDHEVNREDNVFIEQDEQDSVVPNKEEDDQVEENISSKTNQKMVRSKSKTLKATKSLPATPSQLNTKKRRQTFRRTGFQVRDKDFSSIFSELPSDEQLIIAFPCAWRKDVFLHGRMFLSANYICFYTCFFKWEESICIAYKDIVSVTREKSVKVFPNAVKIRTKKDEQYLFATHISREKFFIAIFRLWQNALLDQSLDYQQLRTLVLADQQSHDESSGDSEESVVLENSGEFESGLYSQSLPVTNTQSREVSKKSHRQAVSLSDNENSTSQVTCPCENHLAKTYADRVFALNVDTLFELICGDNSFTRSFHNSQKLTDYTHGEWHVNNETGKRERQVTYNTITQSILGTNALSCREKQVLDVDKPHSMYVLNCEVYNEGMKYTDAFYVATRFCMVQKDTEHSSLRVTGEIRYVKNVNGFIKTFIEKNAHSSVEGGVAEQVRRIEIQSNKSDQKRTSILKQNRKHPTHQKQNEIDEDESLNSTDSSLSKPSIKGKTITGHGLLYDITLVVGIFLIILHVYLCYKLYSIDQVLVTSDAICLEQCKKSCMENRSYR